MTKDFEIWVEEQTEPCKRLLPHHWEHCHALSPLAAHFWLSRMIAQIEKEGGGKTKAVRELKRRFGLLTKLKIVRRHHGDQTRILSKSPLHTDLIRTGVLFALTCLQLIDFGSANGDRTRTLRLERAKVSVAGVDGCR